MVNKLLVISTVSDSKAELIKHKLNDLGYHGKISTLTKLDAYTIEKNLTETQLHDISQSLFNPVVRKLFLIGQLKKEFTFNQFDWAVEIGFLPGVTDNIGTTVKELVTDITGKGFNYKEGCYSSQIIFIKGNIGKVDILKIAAGWYNPLIQNAQILPFPLFLTKADKKIVIPKVALSNQFHVDIVDLNISDTDLEKLGKQGIQNSDGTRRGPLALSVSYLKSIRNYYVRLGRNPTDIELESLAQTWSEHCKHTIFANPVDNIKEGLFNYYIKRATEEIRKKKGKKDICVSVFKDNSGGVKLDENNIVTHKVETHNTPCALDPFGGSVTGIVGVNRDTLGFGMGATPVANYYGFCLADPGRDVPLYRNADLTGKMLSSQRIMDGVISGVNAGGNQSGIPTPMGFLYFDEKYRGKPLVFVGTVGIIPFKINGKKSYIKKAKNGDLIVMAGGRVGKDGIHGATFSSESLNPHSPVTAVQIGDPITQKKLSDVLLKEARNALLYNSITDNGAGGLSCSVAEMAKESNGVTVNLDKVPLKYPGLAPWEIWISESQERMTLAVPKKNWKKLYSLFKSRGVEATAIGEFNSGGKCRVYYKDRLIMDLRLDFLHDGLPERKLSASYIRKDIKNPRTNPKKDYTNDLLNMLERPGLASFEFITKQFDHTVGGNSLLPPLQGRGRINSETTAIRPVPGLNKGVMMSYGLYPSYSEIDTYKMAAATIDTAVRNLVASGADPEKICLLDNFCWTDSYNPYRIGQLESAVKACYDFATFYQTPFISGKDSMSNEFRGFDRNGKITVIQIPPTLLISSLAIIDRPQNIVSLDMKNPGDLIYLLGETQDEMGGSEYFRYLCDKNKDNHIGNHLPQVNAKKNLSLYQTFFRAIIKELISSSISVGKGGLAISLAKSAMGGMCGFQVILTKIAHNNLPAEILLFSESQGRILVTISPDNKYKFENMFKEIHYRLIGAVSKDKKIIIQSSGNKEMVACDINSLLTSYRKTFKDY